MLRRLNIDNYALIDHLDITFPDGLVIITGETGAGKSILLGAVFLLLGSKADVSSLKDRNRNCVVEAEFMNDGEEYILRRVISQQGRSRAFINDEPATLEQLRTVAAGLVDIHSQHQHLLLNDSKFQLNLIDSYAGISAQVKEYSAKYSDYLGLRQRIEELENEIIADEKNRDYLQFQYEQLYGASLVSGEVEELESEREQLSHSEFIKENLQSAILLYDDESSLDSRLKGISSAVDRVSRYFTSLSSVSERIESVRVELKDIVSELSSCGERVSFNPQRLEQINGRLDLLYNLFRKHNVSTVEELIELRDSIALRLEQSTGRTEELQSLKREASELESCCKEKAKLLHEARLSSAPGLSKSITLQIRSLEMPAAEFRVSVVRKEIFGPDGMDEVSFLFNANGGPLTELSKCASGGEMSRLMLSIKDLMSRYSGMPTMIFDEIDTGVSGSIADKMGRLIVRMGGDMQVFAITHLPQVASKGSAHFLVYKERYQDGSVSSHIRQIEGEERVTELARMLSGEHLTPAALENARVLLEES